MVRVEYKEKNVLEAARLRIKKIFDEFENIVVSVSGGKDSTTLFHLCREYAEKRGRKFKLFFLDQEAEYDATIDQIEHLMDYPCVIPNWYQVPIDLTNATSFESYLFRAWEEGASWLRPKSEISIQKTEGHPERFYKFMSWYEKEQEPGTAIMVGLRSKESLNRFRAISQNAGHKKITWTTKTDGEGVYRAYPIYDWKFEDVWKWISDNGFRYNKIYDLMYAEDGINKSRMRISNLIHERSFHSLVRLRKYEPDTFSRMCKRLSGVHFASIYHNRKHGFDVDQLPDAFESWKEYRDFLLETTPTDKKSVYEKRFKKQKNNKQVYRYQCRQILINDWENNVPVTSKGISDHMRNVWRKRLQINEQIKY